MHIHKLQALALRMCSGTFKWPPPFLSSLHNNLQYACDVQTNGSEMSISIGKHTLSNIKETGVPHILLLTQQAIRETAESSSAHATITYNYPEPPSTGVPKVCRTSHYSLMILNGPDELMFFILTQQAVKSAPRHSMRHYKSIALAIPSHISFQANPEASDSSEGLCVVHTQRKPAGPTC